ncbi:MAG: hypothetical protein K2X81_24650 [Candidatus Obscuribacterales bacterium]|nr:hypothetical protein [Candidatus Obscuribacterales bacterium]
MGTSNQVFEKAERNATSDKVQCNDNFDRAQLMSERNLVPGKTDSVSSISALPSLELIDNNAKQSDKVSEQLIAQAPKADAKTEMQNIAAGIDAKFSVCNLGEAKQAHRDFQDLMNKPESKKEGVRTFDQNTGEYFNSQLEETQKTQSGMKIQSFSLKHGSNDDWHDMSTKFAIKLNNGIEVYGNENCGSQKADMWIHVAGTAQMQKLENVKMSDLNSTLTKLQKIQTSSDVPKQG